MAQIKINDLPLATSASFSDNDYFLILDNGEARLLSRPTFQAYMLANVQGEKGDTGAQGLAGVDGRTVQSINFNSDLSVTVTYTDATTVTSDAPPKQYGWGVYKDGQYSDISPLTVPTNTQVVLPNNKATTTEHLPTSVATFYNNTTQKYLFADTAGFYSVKVKFKIAAGTQTDYINVSFNKGTTDLPYSEDRSVRGDSQIQNMSFNTTIHGDSALAANGLTINLKTYGRSMVCYDFEVTVSKLI